MLPFALDRGTMRGRAGRGRGAGAVLPAGRGRHRAAPPGRAGQRLHRAAPGGRTRDRAAGRCPAGPRTRPGGLGAAHGAIAVRRRVAIDSDLPQGAGLSSSASLECVVALALTQLQGIDIARPQLAASCPPGRERFRRSAVLGITTAAAVPALPGRPRPAAGLLQRESDAVPLDPAASAWSCCSSTPWAQRADRQRVRVPAPGMW